MRGRQIVVNVRCLTTGEVDVENRNRHRHSGHRVVENKRRVSERRGSRCSRRGRWNCGREFCGVGDVGRQNRRALGAACGEQDCKSSKCTIGSSNHIWIWLSVLIDSTAQGIVRAQSTPGLVVWAIPPGRRLRPRQSSTLNNFATRNVTYCTTNPKVGQVNK